MLGSMLMLLAGCWIPENFNVNVAVKKDGGYTFTYDGILTYAPALEAAKNRELSLEDEAELKEGAKDLREETEIQKVKYLGKGRYKIYAKTTVAPGNDYDFLDIFTVTSLPDGMIKITVAKLDNDTRNQLKSIGAKINGELTVDLQKGVSVIKHNAQSKPKMFGLLGSYKWKIKSFNITPEIVVKPAY
jgi:hypothetical protein